MLSQAFGLARLQEEKLHDQRPWPLSRPCPPPLVFPRLNPLPPLSSFLPALPPPSPRPPSLPPTFIRLSPDEITSRREQGLCFSCDEKYHRGHRCASKVFFFITEEDEPPDLPNIATPIPDLEINPPDTSPINLDPYSAQLSLNSLAGYLVPETLCFVVTISGHAVVLLVDGGSTHNFIQQQLVPLLGLSPTPTTPLQVIVGNGQQVYCTCVCKAVSISIRAMTFIVDLHVLPISGANVVLGVQWLKSLGHVLTNYNTLVM